MNKINAGEFCEFPKEWDVKELLSSIVNELTYSSVIDFGCGDGRLCESFDPNRYLGVDFDKKAIEIARNRFRKYRFENISKDVKFADIYLAYTTFLQISDCELNDILTNIRCKWMIVCEVLGKELHNDNITQIYNRDLNDYIHLMRLHDLILHKHVKRPQGKNVNISFLIFKKCLSNPLSFRS